MKFHCRPMVVSERDPWRRCVPSLDSLSWDLTGGHKHLFIWAQNSLLPTCTYRLWIRWWNCVSQHVSHNVISADNYQLCWPPHHPHPQFIYLTFLHWFEIKVLRLFLHTYYKVSFRVGTGNVISWHWPNWILPCNYQQRHFWRTGNMLYHCYMWENVTTMLSEVAGFHLWVVLFNLIFSDLACKKAFLFQLPLRLSHVEE